ncbi:hypothetical protein C8J57DRAFT_1262949 [Mycena rebaudengoi]|nr:hypothetical protein C8J57DRAFT_1262949 [Mycena rebaudengoi]
MVADGIADHSANWISDAISVSIWELEKPSVDHTAGLAAAIDGGTSSSYSLERSVLRVDARVRWVQGYTAGPEDVGAADMGGSVVADVRVAAGEGGKEGSAIVVGRGGWWSLHNASGATGRRTRRGRSRKGRVGLWTLVPVFG